MLVLRLFARDDRTGAAGTELGCASEECVDRYLRERHRADVG